MKRLPRPFAALLSVAVLGVFVALSYGFYAPPGSVLPYGYLGVGSDPYIFVWFLHWWLFALQQHLPLFHSYYVDAPTGMDLSWKTGIITLAALAAPLTLKYGAFFVYNLLMILSPALAGWAVYLCAVTLTRDYVAAFVSGVIFAFSSYMLGHMHGELNMSCIFAVPFSLFLCLRAGREGWRWWSLAITLGIMLALEFGISQEIFAAQCLFGVLAWCVCFWLWPQGRDKMLRLAPGIVAGIGLAVLLVSPLIWLMLIHYGGAAGITSPSKFSNDLLEIIFPSPMNWLGGGWFAPLTSKFKGDIYENTGYIGLPLLVLLGVLYKKYRQMPAIRIAAWLALVFVVLSFGPYLHVMGVWVSTAPWILVYKLPFLKAMLPVRFTLFMWLAIVLMLAVWLAAPGTKAGRYIILAACLVFLLPNHKLDRVWGRLVVPTVLTDGTIEPGSQIMILPEAGYEIGLQYAAGMRFKLVGQGYLGLGEAQPFKAWPLYQALMQGKFNAIDPPMLTAFLATYGVQDIVVLFPHSAASVALLALLNKAGWRLTRQDANAFLLLPPKPNPLPDQAQVNAFLRMMPPQVRHHRLEQEGYWVCGLRMLGRLPGVSTPALLSLYETHMHPLEPPSAIKCDLK